MGSISSEGFTGRKTHITLALLEAANKVGTVER
jgi:hypothetical protein